jgi:transposase
MGQAKPLSTRERVISLRKLGQTQQQIASDLQISIGSVKNWLKRHNLGEEFGLISKYENCGRKTSEKHEKVFRLFRLLKHLHPTWGLPLIHLKVGLKYPNLSLQSIRQYQRRINIEKGVMPRSILPTTSIAEQSRIAHNTWQIDAKERLVLENGQECCYLTVADEGTGSLLAARPFPPPAN